MTLLIASDYKRGNSYKVRVCIRITRSNQSRALPLISRQSPRLVRPSVFLARSARLARYAVAQRVQNSRVWPHNGLNAERAEHAREFLRKLCGLGALGVESVSAVSAVSAPQGRARGDGLKRRARGARRRLLKQRARPRVCRWGSGRARGDDLNVECAQHGTEVLKKLCHLRALRV